VSFTVDSLGRTTEARGKITGSHLGREKAYTLVPSVGRKHKEAGDHKGHLIPENGVNDPKLVNVRQNIVWEASKSNLSDKKKFENYAAKIADNNPGSEVWTTHKPLYKDDAKRPFAVEHSIELDGKTIHSVSIYNR
jgi:hypothetical protein